MTLLVLRELRIDAKCGLVQLAIKSDAAKVTEIKNFAGLVASKVCNFVYTLVHVKG